MSSSALRPTPASVLLPQRLAAVEQQVEADSNGNSTTDPQDDAVELARMLQALRSPVVHGPSEAEELHTYPTNARVVMQPRNRDDDDELDSDDEVETELRLYGKRAPLDEPIGKGAAPTAGSTTTSPLSTADQQQIQSQIQRVLAVLNATTKRGALFGPQEEDALADSIREAAFDHALASPAAAPVAPTAAAAMSGSDVAHYLTATPLLYTESAVICSPQTDFPLHHRSKAARAVYEQTVQALHLHACMHDFVRKEKKLTMEQAAQQAKRIAEREARKSRRRASRSTSVQQEDTSDSDEEDGAAAVPTELTSISFDAATAAAASYGGDSPSSPVDPELRSLLLTLEAAFDMPDKVTQKVSQPFRVMVSDTLTLAQSLMRLHQTRLDAHPVYGRSSFPSTAMFRVFYEQENVFLNAKMNDIGEALQFERTHPRPHEAEARKKRDQQERQRKADRDAAAATAAANQRASRKKQKSSFFSCCASTADDSALDDNRPYPRPSDSHDSPPLVDDTCITRWNDPSTNFHESFDLLLRVLFQYEHTLDLEFEREEAEAREKEKKKRGMRLEDIDFDQLRHPDEVAEEEAAAAAAAAASQRHPADDHDDDDDLASERARTVPIFTTRSWNAHPLRQLGSNSRKLLLIFCETWRVGLPYALARSLGLLADNLNFNQAEYYALVNNQLGMQHALYKANTAILDSRAAGRSAAAVAVSITGSGATTTMPFTTVEVNEFKRVVREWWEWVTLSLQRYQLVFARTTDAPSRSSISDDESEDSSAHTDGLKECLHLFIKLHGLMNDLGLCVSTKPGTSVDDAPPEVPLSVVDLLKSIVEAAVATHYESLVELTARGEVAASSPQEANKSPGSEADTSKIRSAAHLTRLIRLVTDEVRLDSERSRVFKEVARESGLDVEVASRRQPESPTSDVCSTPATATTHPDGFHLPIVSHTYYLTALWSDARIFLASLSARHADLSKQNAQSHRTRLQSAIDAIERSASDVLRLHLAMRDFFDVVTIGVPNLPPMQIDAWFAPFATMWVSRLRQEWIGSAANTTTVSQLATILALPTMPHVLDVTHEQAMRHSASLVSLFTQLRVHADMLRDLPGQQADIVSFADLVTQILSGYLSALLHHLTLTLDRESKKKQLWGLRIGSTGQMELCIPADLFVRINDIYLVRRQAELLLEEMQLKTIWANLKPDRVGPMRSVKPIRRTPSSLHAPDSPVLDAPELPSSKERTVTEKQSTLSVDPTHLPVDSPLAPIADDDIPASVLSVLECRSFFREQSRALDDVLARCVSGLGVFVEQHVHSVIWKEGQADDEWTGRHTKEEIDPLFAYLQRHFDHIRLYLLDPVFCRLLFLLLCDFVLILEREMVHPAKCIYKNRLRTEQVHRVIQIHYIVLDWFETDFQLPSQLVQQLRDTHLTRLEYLETLLTGGSETLVEEFDAIDAAVDEENHRLPFAARETYRLTHPPHLSRRQISGILKVRQEAEGDVSQCVTAFIKAHKAGILQANYFQ